MTRWQEQSDEFHVVLKEIGDLHDKKGRDYGTNTDQYANIRSSKEFGVEPWLGAYIRLNDKIGRIKSFVSNGKLENESLEDSLIDIANYAIIALVLYREGNGVKKKVKEPEITYQCCVPSNTNEGKVYTVQLFADDIWTCECKGFQYRGDCTHIKSAQDLHRRDKLSNPNGYILGQKD